MSLLSRRSICSVAVGERQLKEAGRMVVVTSGPWGHRPDSSHHGGAAATEEEPLQGRRPSFFNNELQEQTGTL